MVKKKYKKKAENLILKKADKHDSLLEIIRRLEGAKSISKI